MQGGNLGLFGKTAECAAENTRSEPSTGPRAHRCDAPRSRSGGGGACSRSVRDSGWTRARCPSVACAADPHSLAWGWPCLLYDGGCHGREGLWPFQGLPGKEDLAALTPSCPPVPGGSCRRGEWMKAWRKYPVPQFQGHCRTWARSLRLNDPNRSQEPRGSGQGGGPSGPTQVCLTPRHPSVCLLSREGPLPGEPRQSPASPGCSGAQLRLTGLPGHLPRTGHGAL